MRFQAVGRRQFLQSGLAVAGASAVRTAGAEAPEHRWSGGRYKLSLAAYSYRTLLEGPEARLTLLDFVRDCARFGLEGMELTSYYFPQPLTREFLLGLKRECFRLGLDISGTAVRNDFGLEPGPERDRWLQHVKDWVDHSALLGAPVIRVFAGDVPAGSSDADAHRRIVAGLEECCAYAGQQGIHLALENHGGPTATVEGLLALARDVQSPWFGVNLDTGNFQSNDVYGDLAKAAPLAINVQVKVVVTGRDGVKQPTNMGCIARILRDAGYRGYVVLELEEPGDPREECPRHLAAMREAFA